MYRPLCVSAFKDINRGEWSSKNIRHQRSLDDYISWFGNLTKVPIDLVLFCDEPVASEIKRRTGFKNIYSYQESDTFFKYLEYERYIMESSYYKNLVKNTADWPEHAVPEYNLVNHCKVNFLRRAKSMFPDYTHYVWVDFGYKRDATPRVPQWSHILNDRINYAVDRKFTINELPSPEDLIKNPEKGSELCQGALFTVPSRLVEWFEMAYDDALKEYYKRSLSDDDQSVILLVIKNNPDNFNFHIRKVNLSLLYG